MSEILTYPEHPIRAIVRVNSIFADENDTHLASTGFAGLDG
jgi:hypothetical protein